MTGVVGRNQNIAALMGLLASSGLPSETLKNVHVGGHKPVQVPTTRRRLWFGKPKDKPLVTSKRHPSQYGCLRYDQRQRKRKIQLAQNRKLRRRYKRKPVEDSQR